MLKIIQMNSFKVQIKKTLNGPFKSSQTSNKHKRPDRVELESQ